MIGMPMGTAGIFAVDLEGPEKPGIQPGQDGISSWAQLEAEHGPAPQSRTHTTPSTGRHLLFRRSEPIRNVQLGKIAPGIEIKGDGGYIILPPSRMVDGKQYATCSEDEIAPAPDWLVRRIMAWVNRAAPAKANGAAATPHAVSDEEAAMWAACAQPNTSSACARTNGNKRKS
jgi:hypothetical protein